MEEQASDIKPKGESNPFLQHNLPNSNTILILDILSIGFLATLPFWGMIR